MMLMDIISEVVTSEPDLVIVDKITEGANLGPAARRVRADVVIVQQASTSDRAEQAEFLSVRGLFKVIALADDARQGFLYELRPHCTPLGELSAGGLVAAIRAAAHSKPS